MIRRDLHANHRTRWRTALAQTLVLALGLGCAGIDDGRIDPEAGAASDAGADTATPPASDGGILPGLPYDDMGLSRADGFGNGDVAETPICNDALFGAEAVELDCQNSACQNVASCCVGRGDCCGDTPNLAPASLPSFVGCGTDVLGCLGETRGRLFGSPTPSITADGTFAPGGDGNFDSGLLLERVVDLRSTRLSLKAHFVTPSDCGPGCLEGAAVSVSTQDLFDETTRVDMLAGLVLSGSRADVSLIVAGRDVQSWPASDASTWTLLLTPDGRVQVLADGMELLTSPVGYVPAGAARIVLSGHDLNPTPGRMVAGLSGLEIEASRCDIPTGWSDHRDLVLRERGLPATLSTPVSALGTAVDESGSTLAALVIENALFIAGRPGADPSELTLTTSLDNPSYSPPVGSTLGSPALLTGPENSFLLLPVETDGESALMWGTVDGVTRAVTIDSTPLLSPDSNVRSFEDPTVARVDASRVVIVVRRVHRNGPVDFGVYVASESAMSPRELTGLHLNDALTASSAPGYDADEVGGLALVGQDHAWQLYYARRRGARWSIGLLVSDDMIFWRHAEGGESVLLPDGSPVETVGVRGPAVTFADERVTLSYLGLDGSRSWPRFVTRSATANGIWR
ncbi:MAG: hypothetical protein GXP55_16620 [Deltaproteobacteria bacterium]|nr:hypothetical protein [Deltaproteobacteria bacterium]